MRYLQRTTSRFSVPYGQNIDTRGKGFYTPRVRILALLNSNVTGGDAQIPKEDLFPARMGSALAKALGEEVEVIARNVWPTPRLAGRVDTWVKEFQPELVLYSVTGFWFLYESTPVRLERRLGKPGRALGRISREAAARPWLAHNPVFRWSRKQTQKAVGGQAWFTADQVAEASTKVVSAVLRNESSYLVVLGPSGGDKWAKDARHLESLRARRQMVDTRVGDFCRAHHVEYWDQAKMASLKDPRGSSLQGDELHLDAEGHRRVADYQFGFSLDLVKRALAASRNGQMVATART